MSVQGRRPRMRVESRAEQNQNNKIRGKAEGQTSRTRANPIQSDPMVSNQYRETNHDPPLAARTGRERQIGYTEPKPSFPLTTTR
jgi:hypothetical protein